MISLHIKLYKEKLDGTVDYDKPWFRPGGQFVLQDLNDLEDRLTENLPQIQETIEKWTYNGSGLIVDRVIDEYYYCEMSTLEG